MIIKKYQLFLEAFLSKDKENAVEQIISYITRNSNVDLYPYNELFYIQKENLFLTGQLFLSLKTSKAIRINWIDGDLRSEIHSIDLWVDFEFDTNPQFTLTLEGISIVKVLPEIVKFLNNPQSFVKSGVKNLQLQENDENASRLSDLEGKYKRARSAEKKEQIKGQIERLKAAVAQDEKAKLESDNVTSDDLNLDVFKSIELYTIQVAKKKSNSLIISGQAGVGKCHGKGTKIIMFNGTIKSVEDIEIGDILMGDDSSPRIVQSLGRGVDEMYRIGGRAGFEEFTCNSDHILSLKHTISKEIENISVRSYLNLSNYQKRLLKLYKRGVEFKDQEVEFDPYLLGIWIGDGSCKVLEIETEDKEIVEYLQKISIIENTQLKKHENKKSNSDGYRLTVGNISGKGVNKNPLINKFRKYGLLNGLKFIPNEFLFNSRYKRLSLLAGIIDTDGYQFNKTYSVTTKFPQLADQIKFLCRSLGFHAHISKKIVKNIGKNKKVGTYFNINISGNLSEVPVLLNRKKISQRKQIKDPLVSGIKIESIGQGDYYGFTIDSNNLYLLQDFTVTHNTQTVKDTLKSLGMVTDVDYFTTTGTITTAGLYEVLFKNRHKLIVFDDCDAVFKESDSINLLKGALDTYEVREISKMTKGNTFDSMGMSDEEIEATYQEDPSKLPNKFGFNGQVIFISNLPEDKFDDALLSRSLHVDVHLNKSELIERMKTLMHKISPELDDELKQEALDYLIYVTETYPVKFDLNIRTLIHSINLRAGNDEDITIGERSEKVWKLLIKKYLVKAKRKI